MDLKYFKKYNINAGFTQAPDLSDVRRAAMAEEAAEKGGFVIRPCLIHGTDIVDVNRDFLNGKPSYIEIEDCDGLITALPGVVLTSTHGDCIPVYAFDHQKRVAGLVHAGWKGTAAGIAGILIEKMIDLYDCCPDDISAVIGPGIGRCHFEVSEDVRDIFDEKISWIGSFIDKGAKAGKYMIDLKGINAEFIKKQGVTDIEISPVCTFEGQNCYSYRRNGTQKRMLAYISV